jgi:hypothetical protein
MNLIDEWNRVPSNDVITLSDEHGDVICTVTKKGSFANTIRRLTETVPEKDILSDRWRWRVK